MSCFFRAFFLCMILTATGFGDATARQAHAGHKPLIIIRNDKGGIVQKRIAEIANLREIGARVEIRGAECLSACTIYLALPDTCVSHRTSLGFHGPSYFGAALSPERFDYWSRKIAAHYPEPLRNWYMRKGRTRITGYFHLKGADLARLGVRLC